MRKLATVRRISNLLPIEGADRIEVAVVDGWKVVVKKDEFDVDDLCVFIEIDSWVPHSLAPFLTEEGKKPKVYKGIEGQRLRTVKLRKQLSQGLVLSLAVLPKSAGVNYGLVNVGDDFTADLGIIKYDLEEDTAQANKRNVAYDATRRFPTHLFPKTDQERIQNCFLNLPRDNTWEATLKLDGSSCSIFILDGKLRVCSRNIELRTSAPAPSWWNKLLYWAGIKKPVKFVPDNHFVKMALQVESKLRAYEGVDGLVFQGELMGPGIQKNREDFEELKWFVYDIYDIELQEYLSSTNRRQMCKVIGLDHAPVIDPAAVLFDTAEEHLELASSTKSINNPIGEGIVYKSNQNFAISFKAISNKYLLKEE